MKFTVPLILSVILIIVAIIIGATVLKGSWCEAPDKTAFEDYYFGMHIYKPSCGTGADQGCHEAKDLKEYYVAQVHEWKQGNPMCPEVDPETMQPEWPESIELGVDVEEKLADLKDKNPGIDRNFIRILENRLAEIKTPEEKAEQLEEKYEELEEAGREDEALKLSDELDKITKRRWDTIHKFLSEYMLRSVSTTKDDAERYKKEKYSTKKALRFVKFVSYKEGMKLVAEKKRPYIIELSQPFSI
jgi:hypothetical protein